MGSTIALCKMLRQKGKEVCLFCESEIPEDYFFLEEAKESVELIEGYSEELVGSYISDNFIPPVVSCVIFALIIYPILKAFEIIVGKEVVRPDIAGLMGAYGVALIALNNFKQYDDQDIRSGILNKEEIENLKIKTTHTRCKGCENHCALTINLFNKKIY